MKPYLKILLLMIADSIVILFSGYTTMRMWNWFVVTALHFPWLHFIPATGISGLFSYLSYQYIPGREGKEWQSFSYNMAISCSTLLAGCILHRLI